MTTVKQLLEYKGNDIWSVKPEDLIIDALKLMAEKNTGALMVMKMGKVVGIVSERDYARKVVLSGKVETTCKVREIMTRDVLCTTPNHSVEDCMALMSDRRIRHLPVCTDGEVIGVISIGDIVKSVISQKEFLIEQLENYITGA